MNDSATDDYVTVTLVRDGNAIIAMIGPDLDETVWMNLTWNQALQVTAEGTHAGDVCFRFKGSFQAGSDYAG